jgi:acetoin utilization protein AcuB
MNLLVPISRLMSTDLVTVTPNEPLMTVKEKFDEHHFHHIPVVEYKKIVGIISKSDLLYFLKGVRINDDTEQFFNNSRLSHYAAKDIMTVRLATVSSNEPVRTAIDVFKENLFHALPVVDNGDLVGIITTHDIIAAIADERISLMDYATAGE